MSWKELFKPDEKKIIVFIIIFLTVFFIRPSTILGQILFYYYAKTSTPSEFGQFLTSYGSIFWILIILDVIYFYFIASWLIRFCKHKRK